MNYPDTRLTDTAEQRFGLADDTGDGHGHRRDA